MKWKKNPGICMEHPKIPNNETFGKNKNPENIRLPELKMHYKDILTETA